MTFPESAMAEVNKAAQRCNALTTSVSNMQADQLGLVSESCLSKQPYSKDVSKSQSLCSLGQLQRKYNALQAEATILFGIKKLNDDAQADYQKMTDEANKTVAAAKSEADQLARQVEKINVLHSALKDPHFVQLAQNQQAFGDPAMALANYCAGVESPCLNADDESFQMLSGFLKAYQSKKQASFMPYAISDVTADFNNYDRMLVAVPDDKVMSDLQKNIDDLASPGLNENQKKAGLSKIQEAVGLLKQKGFFDSSSNTTADQSSIVLGDILSLASLSEQQKILTTSAIDLLLQDVNPYPESIGGSPISLVEHRNQNILPNYTKFHQQSLVNKNNTYAKNLSDSIQKDINEIVTVGTAPEFKNSMCPGNIEQYSSIGSEAVCSNLYSKYKDLVEAKELAVNENAQAYSGMIDRDYRAKLRDIGCLEKTDMALDGENKKSILDCIKEKSLKGGVVDRKLAENQASLEEIKKQIAVIYKTDKYMNIDQIKNKGITSYLNQGCEQAEIRLQSTLVYCDKNQPEEMKVSAFVDMNGQVISAYNSQGADDSSEKNKKFKKSDKNVPEDLVNACADAELAERSGIVCEGVNKHVQKMKEGDQKFKTMNNINYEYKDGKVVATSKKPASAYYGAGMVNAMGTALSSFRNYQNTMGVVNVYKQSAAYSAMAEYNAKNQLYWTPTVPTSATNPYLYTGTPLGVNNPYSTNFNYNNNSYYYNTTYDPLASAQSSSGSSNASFNGFNFN